jgi:Leucine-rich repeat (LRR) protein
VKGVKTLKVMHCNSLTSTDGIEEYEGLEHLDLSLNQLEAFNADRLSELIYLNLSCNSIKLAPNLKHFRELVTLNLSHNRIEDLSPFEELSGMKNSLKEINLNDNMISDIDQVAYLCKFKYLIKVHFQDKKRNTDNPI